MEETIPKDMYSAIEDELQSTKEELNKLKAEMDDKENEIVNYNTDVAKLKSEKTQINEVHWKSFVWTFFLRGLPLRAELYLQQI